MSKWFSIEVLPGPVTKSKRRIPERASSSTMYCTTGLRPTGNISFGWLLVEGKSRVPCPATGTTARSIGMAIPLFLSRRRARLQMLVQPVKPALVDVAHARRIRREVAGDRVGDELGLDAVIAQGVEEPVRLRHRH